MKTAQDPRHLRRRKIVQELFAWDAQNKVPAATASKKESTGPDLAPLIQNLKLLDSLISNSAPEWGIDKINNIDLAILRLAAFELVVEDKEPAKVVIDEAVELAKEFGGENSPQFVNGALGKILGSQKRTLRMAARRLGVDQKSLTRDAHFTSDLNATPLEVADLITNLENDLQIEIPANTRIETVGDLLDIIDEQRT